MFNFNKLDIFKILGGSYDFSNFNNISFDGVDSNTYTFGSTVSSNGSGTRLAIGAPNYSNDSVTYCGLVRVYDYSSSNGWEQIGSDIEGAEDDYYGKALKLSYDGTTLIIGSSKDDKQGYVRIYEYAEGDWNQKGSDILGSASTGSQLGEWDNFGHSVAINNDGTIIAIGVPKFESDDDLRYIQTDTYYWVGCVEVYEYDGSTWNSYGSYTEVNTNGIYYKILPQRLYSNNYTGATIDMNYDGTIIAASTPGYYKGGGLLLWFNMRAQQVLGVILLKQM